MNKQEAREHLRTHERAVIYRYSLQHFNWGFRRNSLSPRTQAIDEARLDWLRCEQAEIDECGDLWNAHCPQEHRLPTAFDFAQ